MKYFVNYIILFISSIILIYGYSGEILDWITFDVADKYFEWLAYTGLSKYNEKNNGNFFLYNILRGEGKYDDKGLAQKFRTFIQTTGINCEKSKNCPYLLIVETVNENHTDSEQKINKDIEVNKMERKNSDGTVQR